MSEKFPQFEEGKFIKDKYWEKQEFRQAVEKTAEKKKRSTEETTSSKPNEQISLFLERLEEAVEKKGRLFKEISLYPRFVIKPENITDEYLKKIIFSNFAEIKGYNREQLNDPKLRKEISDLFKKETDQNIETYVIPPEEKEKEIERIITDQKESLDLWFEYLTSQEAKENYLPAFRYWAFAEMTKLGVYDSEKKDFAKRTNETIAPFPELNQQALAFVLDEVLRKHTGKPSFLVFNKEQQKEFEKRLASENFGKLYGFALDYLHSLKLPEERLIIAQGEWRKFPQGSDPKKLYQSLQGFNTQWCIAALGTAESYLSHSDLLIYYSEDEKGKKTIPRACIVAKKDKITEVRGILQSQESKQHLDSYITPVVEKKLQELPGGKEWQETMSSMKKLAEIHLKHLHHQPLSKEDLIILYEIESPIKNTGYGKDPRIEKILKERDKREDFSFVFNIPKEKISLTKEEALQGGILFHYGHLDLFGLTSAEGLELPKEIGGYLNLSSLTSAKGLELPEKIRCDLDLRKFTSAEGLKLPEEIGGYLNLSSLTSAKGLELPEKIGGSLNLYSLTSAEGLELPEKIGGSLYFQNLTSAEGLELPEKIGGGLYLPGLTSAEGLELPEKIGESVYLDSLNPSQKDKLRQRYPKLKII